MSEAIEMKVVVGELTSEAHEKRVVLWDAINQYVVSCKGDPSVATASVARMDAVVAVERAVQQCKPNRDLFNRMATQARALANEDCEFDGEPCFGCATCYARETVRLLTLMPAEDRCD